MPHLNSFGFLVLAMAVAASLSACDYRSKTPTGGSYPPVTAEKLLSATFSHRTGQDHFQFRWKFDADQFVIEGEQIPPDLTDALLGPNQTAKKISGKWKIQNDRIYFEVPAGEDQPPIQCDMSIFSSGVIRIQSSDAQYVF